MINIKSIISDIEFLPAFNNTAMKVVQMLKDEDVSLKEIGNVIRFDPSLTANILKLSNSSSYIHRNEITDIYTAINYIGKQKLNDIIMVSASKKYFVNQLEGYENSTGELWEHCLFVAIIASEIKYLEPQLSENDIFTAGLLHDIGKIILSKYVFRDIDKIFKLVEEQYNFLEAEKMILGYNHMDIGASILKKWNFKKDIILAAKYHHQPYKLDNPMVNLISLGEYFSMVIGKMSQKDSMAYSGYADLLNKYNIKSHEIEVILSNAIEKANKVIEEMKV